MFFSLKPSVSLPLLLVVSAPVLSESTETANKTATETAIEEVVVTSYQQPYRGNVAEQDRPQALQQLERVDLDERGVHSFQDALDSSASVARQNNTGGLWDSYALRGFPGNENMPSGYLVNGFSGGRGFSGNRDMSNVESIEVLKGPGAALYGRSEPGGTINVVTRKPEFESAGYIKGETGRFGHRRVEADITGALSDTMAGRVNGAWANDDSFRDHVYSRKRVLTPSLLKELGDNTSLLYEMEYVRQDQVFDRGVVVLNGDFDTVPRSRFLGEPDDGPIRTRALGHQLSLDHMLDNGWQLTAGISQRNSGFKGYSSEAELSASRQSLLQDGSTLTRQRRYRDYSAADKSARLELSGEEWTGAVRHNLMVGADGYRYQLDTDMDRYRGAAGSYAIDIHNPVYGSSAPALTPLYRNHEVWNAWGIYLQDQMELNADWQLLLGARYDRFRQQLHEQLANTSSHQADGRWSPRVGVVYVLNDSTRLYSSYSEGFMPVSGSDYQGDAFEPEASHSLEAGVKYESERLQGTVAVFDAVKSNILTADPVNAGFSASLGEARSQGLELDVAADLTERLNASLAWSWLYARTTRDAISADWGVLVPEGSGLVNIPRHTLNLTLKQQLDLYGYQNHAGVRLRHVGARPGDAADPDYRLPAYSLVDVFAGTELGDGLDAALYVDNLLDESYIRNSYSALWNQPGEPRNIRASLTYEF